MTIGSNCRTVDGTVIAIPRHVGGVAVEGVVGDEAFREVILAFGCRTRREASDDGANRLVLLHRCIGKGDVDWLFLYIDPIDRSDSLFLYNYYFLRPIE